MRKKNRKKKSGGIAFPAPFAMVIAIASVLSICYLFLGARCMAIGEEIKVLEAQQQDPESAILFGEALDSPAGVLTLVQGQAKGLPSDRDLGVELSG